MQKSTKIVLGIATVWPMLYILLFLCGIFAFLFFMPQRGPGGAEAIFPILLPLILGLHMLTIFGSLALTVYYIVNVLKNARLDQNQKILWTIMIFFGAMIAEPVYWYLHIWREEPAALSAASSPAYLKEAQAESWTNRTTSYRRAPEGEYVPPPEPPNWRE